MKSLLKSALAVTLVCVSLIFSSSAYSKDVEWYSAVVCPRCSAPTVKSIYRRIIEDGTMPCPNVTGMRDKIHGYYDVTATVCAAQCGYAADDNVEYRGTYIECEHLSPNKEEDQKDNSAVIAEIEELERLVDKYKKNDKELQAYDSERLAEKYNEYMRQQKLNNDELAQIIAEEDGKGNRLTEIEEKEITEKINKLEEKLKRK